MIYDLIDCGLECEIGGVSIKAVGERLNGDDLKVSHFISVTCFDEASGLTIRDLENIAYFILSTAPSVDSIFFGDGVLEILIASGLHPADALEAFRRAKSRVLWGELMEVIFQQCVCNRPQLI